MMAVYRYSTKKGNRYYYKFCLNYKQFLKRGFLTRKDAEFAEASLLINPINNNIKFSVLADMFLMQRKQELKQSSYVFFRDRFKLHISSRFPDINFNKIRNATVINFRNEIAELKCSAKHKNRILSDAKDFFVFVSELGYKNNFKFFLTSVREELKEIEISKKHYITVEEFQRFTAVIDNEKMKLLFTLAFISGCRISEVRAIQVKSLKKNGIDIIQAASSKLGKGRFSITSTKSKSSMRFVPLSEDFYRQLEEYVKSNRLKSNEFLFFGNKKADPIGETTINRYMKKYISLSHVPSFIFHDFRHSVASILSSKVSNNNDVALFLGQSNKEVTEKYYILQREETKREMAELLFNNLISDK